MGIVGFQKKEMTTQRFLTERSPASIEGLDDISGGGFPENRLPWCTATRLGKAFQGALADDWETSPQIRKAA